MKDLHAVALTVNGRAHELAVESRRTLADVLRHDLGYTGTHVGCEHGICGACTVLLDGEPARSCLVFGVQAGGCVRGGHGRVGGRPHRPQDALVPRAAAQVRRDNLADLLVRRRRSLPQERGNQHQETGRAEPALQAVVVGECLLQRTERLGRAERLHRLHRPAICLNAEHEARTRGQPVHQHRARTADTVLAADVRAGVGEVVA